MKLIMDCKNGIRDGYLCPFVVEQAGWGWDDSKAWHLLCPWCFMRGEEMGRREEIGEVSQGS